jgi:DNA-binding NtrC family response regulator
MTAVKPKIHDQPGQPPAREVDFNESMVFLDGIGRGDRPDEAAAQSATDGAESLARFIGRSEPVLWMKRFIEKVAPLEMSVLIGGPSGVGKTLVAEIIHSLSGRAGGPFVVVNCASIQEDNFELELFGAVRNLSKGIEEDVAGKIEDAGGGTLLFNKIGDLPLKVQGRLVGFVESKQLEKPGAKTPIPMDVRILATTNVNLEDRITEGLFREDLYYRLNTLSIQVPPLRDRPEDLRDLIRHLMRRINARVETQISRVSSGALGVLHSHDWPGNVRELRNVLERAAILSDGAVIGEQDARTALREAFGGPLPRPARTEQSGEKSGEKVCLKETLQEMEKRLILEALGNS